MCKGDRHGMSAKLGAKGVWRAYEEGREEEFGTARSGQLRTKSLAQHAGSAEGARGGGFGAETPMKNGGYCLRFCPVRRPETGPETETVTDNMSDNPSRYIKSQVMLSAWTSQVSTEGPNSMAV